MAGTSGGLQVLPQDSFNAADFPALRAANLESISDEGCLSEAPASEESDLIPEEAKPKLQPKIEVQSPSNDSGSKPTRKSVVIIDEADEEDSVKVAQLPRNLPGSK